MPSRSAARKAVSRLGPVVPCVPGARQRVAGAALLHELRLAGLEVGLVPAAGGQRQRDRERAERRERGLTVLRVRLTGREHYPLAERWRVEAALGRRDHALRDALPGVPPGGLRGQRGARLVALRAGRARARSRASTAISSTASGPTSKDSSGRRSRAARAPAWRSPRPCPEWSADSGSAPQAAASAATMPKDSGKVLGITCASQAGSRSGRSSCSSRPVKWIALGGRRARRAASRRPTRVEERRSGSCSSPGGPALELAAAGGDLAQRRRGRAPRAPPRSARAPRGRCRSRRSRAARRARAPPRAARPPAAGPRPSRRSACPRSSRSGRCAGSSARERRRRRPARRPRPRRPAEPTASRALGRSGSAPGRNVVDVHARAGPAGSARGSAGLVGSTSQRLSAVWREPTSTPAAPRDALERVGQEALAGAGAPCTRARCRGPSRRRARPPSARARITGPMTRWLASATSGARRSPLAHGARRSPSR